jgi:2-polyprenyl-6-methoxyphenol hydroxylase-like FAD-dependent oxidoreductase
VRRDSLKDLRVVVAGGSLGGLCAGVALRGQGATVDIFERYAGEMETRGAGIVVQQELTSLLKHHGAPPLPTTSCRGRRYLDPDGGNGKTQSMPQYFTSWEAIYLTLRAAFPDAQYHTGAALEGLENMNETDGAQSETRRRLLPQVQPHYAGYIAWRGTVDEALAPPDLVAFFDDTFTFSEARSGGHILVYFIPGAKADTSEGRRQLNWVWYVPAGDDELKQLLTDRQGVLHHNSLPLGCATEESIAGLRARARREVHPRMAELIEATGQPFIQKIVDIVVPRTVFGRVCLLGDAAFVVRPHTAGATAKAAKDAILLADTLREAKGGIKEALLSFQSAQLRYGHELHQYGVALGNRWATAH